jgi:hypothetical protein
VNVVKYYAPGEYESNGAGHVNDRLTSKHVFKDRVLLVAVPTGIGQLEVANDRLEKNRRACAAEG